MRPALFIAFLALISLSLPAASIAKNSPRQQPVRTSDWSDAAGRFEYDPATDGVHRIAASAVANTIVLNSFKFDSGAACTANSWTSVDITAPTGNYWHVDDFALSNSLGTINGGVSAGGVTFAPIQGTKSMWMAKRIPPAGPVDPIHCGYLALPGYGNSWDQSFCSTACLVTSGGPTANLDVAFVLKFDSEPSYDGTELEYTTDCSGNTGWTGLDGGATAAGWSGPGEVTVAASYNIGAGPVKVRLRFTSDSSWSNQDGLYPGFGVAVDSLSWEGTAVEDFESEAVGATSADDWQSCNTPGFGNYLALFKKITGGNYEDPCLDNLGCYWAALQGSTEFYNCGSPSQPSQKVVPHVNSRGQYIANEIWSPNIALLGNGSDFHLRYTVYRDLPLDNLIFHVWHVRTIGAGGCPGRWQDRNFVFYGDSKDWAIVDNAIGTKVDVVNGTAIQVALGVIDMCPVWCGVYGTGACHSPAPYFDSVKVLRVDTVGPQWDVRAIDTFQDTFATNGTITGTARADAAIDIKPSASTSFTPGDSACVLYLVDPKYISGVGTNASGLLNDPNLSTFVGRDKTKKQAYLYVSVWPPQAAKSGAPLSEGPGGQANRYPFSGTVVANGLTWTKIRMDFTYTGTATNPGDGHGLPNPPPFVANRFNVDLNDNVFTPGDTVYYFFGATSADGTTYYSTEYGSTADINAVAANAMEFTILPAGGFNRGGDVLYVNGADGTWNSEYWRGGWLALGMATKVDRYDVRSPSSASSNRLSGRVTSVAAQLNACYHAIFWDTGSFGVTLGDGSGDPEKCDDYALLNTFLGNLTSAGGVYLSGDDVAEKLNGYPGVGAITFKSVFMPFTLINNAHTLAPTSFRISPTIKAWPGRAYTSGGNNDFFVFGGCPEINDFDVIGASGTSRVEMSYNTVSNANGAVISNQVVNGNGKTATVVMSGFSLAQIRDDELDGVFDRALFMRDTMFRLGFSFAIPTAAGPGLRSSLSQNYPNPFNPQTTIAFAIARRTNVRLAVYDVNGALVRTLANEIRAPGAYDVKWDGRAESGQQVASGVYFYKLVAGEFTSTKKMVLLK